MYNLKKVQIPNRLTNLLNRIRRRRLSQPLFLLNDLIELPRRPQFLQQIDIRLIMKEPVKLDDIGMIQIHLYL